MAISKKSEELDDSLLGKADVRRRGRIRNELYGEENVYDFSLGNPNLERLPR